MPQNATITFIAANMPEGSCFTTEQERLNGFVQAMTGSLPGAYSAVNFGSSTPGVDDRDKPWHKTGGDGSPSTPGMWDYFDGAWR